MGNVPSISTYLQALADACLETARDPRLLGVLVGLLRLAPKTLAGLAEGPPRAQGRPWLRRAASS
jgi:hypothetical protein